MNEITIQAKSQDDIPWYTLDELKISWCCQKSGVGVIKSFSVTQNNNMSECIEKICQVGTFDVVDNDSTW